MGYESARFARSLGLSSRECTTCRLAPPAFSRAVAYALYDDATRELLHLLKFRGQRATAELVLGRRLAEAILQLEPDAAAELAVIPVPLFAARERQRGFNQAHLLAHAALKLLRKQRPGWRLTLVPGVITRTRETPHLFSLQPHERRAHLRGAFKVTHPERLAGREVLLLDDILTTGATARECSRILLAAGATKVWVATVARAQPLKLNTIHPTEFFTQQPN
jgi:ComF family protein